MSIHFLGVTAFSAFYNIHVLGTTSDVDIHKCIYNVYWDHDIKRPGDCVVSYRLCDEITS